MNNGEDVKTEASINNDFWQGFARAAIRGFINYLNKYEEHKATNREPNNLNTYEKRG